MLDGCLLSPFLNEASILFSFSHSLIVCLSLSSLSLSIFLTSSSPLSVIPRLLPPQPHEEVLLYLQGDKLMLPVRWIAGMQVTDTIRH